MEKVAYDLYFIKQLIRVDWFFGVTLFLGTDKIGIVNIGFEKTPMDYIFPFIRELQCSSSQIDLVVNTHRGGDHVLGNTMIKKNTEDKIAIHELESESVGAMDICL